MNLLKFFQSPKKLNHTKEDNAISLLERVRFGPERDLQESILKRFGLNEDSAPFQIEIRKNLQKSLNVVRASNLRLTHNSAPRLWTIFEEVKEKLEVEKEFELYLCVDNDLNAGALISPEEADPSIITVTSGLVKQLDDDLLRTVLGHEIAHHHYQHTSLLVDLDLTFADRPRPKLLNAQLRVLNRLHEISADRGGLLALSMDIEKYIALDVQISSGGLGPEHIKFEINDIINELEHIKNLNFSDQTEVVFAEHPLLPIRLRAAQLFAQSELEINNITLKNNVEEEILKLTQLMTFESNDPQSINQRNLLLAGGLLLCHSDEDEYIPDDERAQILELVEPYTDDPYQHLRNLEDVNSARQMLDSAANWVRCNLGKERYELLDKLIEIAVSDGEVEVTENKILGEVADKLGIPNSLLEKQLQDELKRFNSPVDEPELFGLIRK